MGVLLSCTGLSQRFTQLKSGQGSSTSEFEARRARSSSSFSIWVLRNFGRHVMFIPRNPCKEGTSLDVAASLWGVRRELQREYPTADILGRILPSRTERWDPRNMS